MAMDPELEKKLSNEKRLKAIQEWRKNRNQPIINSHKISNSPTKSDDEPVKDDDKPLKDTEENGEKVKNLKILDSVMGYEVNGKFQEERNSTKRKRSMRFDPEDESSSKYLKTQEISGGKSPKKTRGKGEVKKEVTEEIPTNPERYVEVSGNLKDLLTTSSSSFSLTTKFSSNNQTNHNDVFPEVHSFSSKTTEPFTKVEANQLSREQRNNVHYGSEETRNQRRDFYFFITENDNRLKEGLEFFRRKKSLEEVREDWNHWRVEAMDLFRRRMKQTKIVKKGMSRLGSKRNKMLAPIKK